MSNSDPAIYICVGAGGVGKTTVASILGLHFALLGKRALVITVDPAQRLLDALSLSDKSATPKKIDVTSLTNRASKQHGELYALMPDLKKEWADFLAVAIKHKDVARKIADNHFYQYMADGLPGAFEIICSHMMFKVKSSGIYDVIILDTPPSSHSVSFFDVPQKIRGVLEQDLFRRVMNRRNSIFLKLTKKLALFSGGILEKTIERIIGSHFLSELIEFALTIDGLYDPLLERVKAMETLLLDKHTKFMLIVRPSTASVNDGLYLHTALKKRGFFVSEIIVNQVTQMLAHHELVDEFGRFRTENAEQKQQQVIAEILSLYEAELLLEKQLINQISKDFLDVDKRMIFSCDPQLGRNEILASMLSDYEKKVSL
jgi:anion-transporting  ArsA/GET3 family ATPase